MHYLFEKKRTVEYSMPNLLHCPAQLDAQIHTHTKKRKKLSLLDTEPSENAQGKKCMTSTALF